jgi:hypothetical protein
MKTPFFIFAKSKNKRKFAHFRFAKIFPFAKVFVFAKDFAKIFVFAIFSRTKIFVSTLLFAIQNIEHVVPIPDPSGFLGEIKALKQQPSTIINF